MVTIIYGCRLPWIIVCIVWCILNLRIKCLYKAIIYYVNYSYPLLCNCFVYLLIDQFYFVIFLTKYNMPIKAQYIHNSIKAGKIIPHIYKWNTVKYIIQEYTESLSVAPLVVKMNKSFAIAVSSCIARDVHLCIMVYIWIKSRNCGRLVTRPCY